MNNPGLIRHRFSQSNRERRNGGLFDLRPLHMFFEPAERQGQEVPRFTKIADPDVIARLEAIKARLYPNS